MAGKKIDHVGIMVKDLQRSIAFYEEVVGLKLKGTTPYSNGIIQLAFLGFNESGQLPATKVAGLCERISLVD